MEEILEEKDFEQFDNFLQENPLPVIHAEEYVPEGLDDYLKEIKDLDYRDIKYVDHFRDIAEMVIEFEIQYYSELKEYLEWAFKNDKQLEIYSFKEHAEKTLKNANEILKNMHLQKLKMQKDIIKHYDSFDNKEWNMREIEDFEWELNLPFKWHIYEEQGIKILKPKFFPKIKDWKVKDTMNFGYKLFKDLKNAEIEHTIKKYSKLKDLLYIAKQYYAEMRSLSEQDNSKFAERLERAKEYSIMNLLQEFNIEIHRHSMLCINHSEKTPSMHIYESTNKVHCFGCHFTGDVIDCAQILLNTDIIGAVNYLYGKNG